MKLRDVMICLDCDEVFEQEVVHFLDQKITIDHCPACGNQQLFRVSKWLSTMNGKKAEARKFGSPEAQKFRTSALKGN